mmetsp:Transcript_23883/g.43114  ORF Transcript_23883/g.43114 Transcript_23883/m.43114 type:complete len:207 (-) Transcript_23883:208-828(-)
MPRVNWMGLAPAATIFIPSLTKAAERIVAVVVPSPASSLVRWAACSTSLAPMFSTGSGRSISRATVTPSFTILGAPNLDSNTTFRPLGPSVVPTVDANLSTPACIRFRASPFSLKTISFATSKGLSACARVAPYVPNFAPLTAAMETSLERLNRRAAPIVSTKPVTRAAQDAIKFRPWAGAVCTGVYSMASGVMYCGTDSMVYGGW